MQNRIIDIQYAGSRAKGVPFGFCPDHNNPSNLGRYSESWITGAMNEVLAEQQARLGRFLTYKRLLLNLKGRAENLLRAKPELGRSLLGRVNVALKDQSILESDGLSLIIEITNIKKNPLIQAFVEKRIDYTLFSADMTLRADKLIASLKNLLTQSGTLNRAISDHEGNVDTIEKDIIRAEGGIAGRGLLPKVTKLFDIPTKMFKWGTLVVGGVALVYLLSKQKPRRLQKRI